MSSPESTPPPSQAAVKEEPVNFRATIIDALFEKPWKEAEEILRRDFPVLLNQMRQEAGFSEYNILLFLDQTNSIGEGHADNIYSAISRFEDQKDVLLILGSRGGRIEPAYLVSKNCKAISKTKFVVAVPRRAKSAATLLSLGADEIHMGSMSELGPIDPQLGQLPALSLTNAVQTLAKLVSEYPGSADMFSKYLASQLDLGTLGYFERINESAIQYAARLLDKKTLGEGRTPATLAAHLVNHYKDHSFVIDKDEALQLFGPKIIKAQTKEYIFANDLDQELRFFSRVAEWIHRKEITYVGSFENCLRIRDMKEPTK